MDLPKFSLGVGDRFAHQAKPQLRACVLAADEGAEVVPVWNKSHREHGIVGTQPESVRTAADAAVANLGWIKPYFVDADHINLETVDGYVASSDFFTLDVAYAIGKPASAARVADFVANHPELAGRIEIPGIAQPFDSSEAQVRAVAEKYLHAVEEAARIYRHIAGSRDAATFVTEVSMDETDAPQTPPELLIILAAIADNGIPAQTIAPKFTGRFNKGVDYVGDVAVFRREFHDDLAVIAHAIAQYGLPANLKLSVHSGSDKFSIYEPIREALPKFDAGVHLKTAGTTWLEELIGLAEAGGDGLDLAKEVYVQAHVQQEALCAPYAAVIDIDGGQLPDPDDVREWTSEQYMGALRHEQDDPLFNQHVRQLLHVGYKVAAKMGPRYLHMLDECEESISANVTHNLFERHIKPLFLGE